MASSGIEQRAVEATAAPRKMGVLAAACFKFLHVWDLVSAEAKGKHQTRRHTVSIVLCLTRFGWH